MRRALLAAFLFLVPAAASAAPDDAFGVWRTASGEAAVEVVPCDGRACGRLIWYVEKRTGADAGRDSKNPDEAQRTRRLCGLPMIGGFKRTAEGWEDGWIYDPESGNTYSATMTPDGRDRLRLRGYVGIPLLGRTEVWQRAPAGQERCR